MCAGHVCGACVRGIYGGMCAGHMCGPAASTVACGGVVERSKGALDIRPHRQSGLSERSEQS